MNEKNEAEDVTSRHVAFKFPTLTLEPKHIVFHYFFYYFFDSILCTKSIKVVGYRRVTRLYFALKGSDRETN